MSKVRLIVTRGAYKYSGSMAHVQAKAVYEAYPGRTLPPDMGKLPRWKRTIAYFEAAAPPRTYKFTLRIWRDSRKLRLTKYQQLVAEHGLARVKPRKRRTHATRGR